MNIVGLGGSFAIPSSSLQALRVALAAADQMGARTELLDIRELDLPLFGSNGNGTPRDAARLVELAGGADGMIWSSPLYHGTVSAAMKNALDWLELLSDHDPPYLSHTPVGLIATAAGVQGVQGIHTMQFVVRALRGWSVPFVVPISRAYEAFGPDGSIRVPGLADQLAQLGAEVVGAAHRFAA